MTNQEIELKLNLLESLIEAQEKRIDDLVEINNQVFKNCENLTKICQKLIDLQQIKL